MPDNDRIVCPECGKSLGGLATEGGLRMRLGITLIDPASGRIHGPCPQCKKDVTIADVSQLSTLLQRLIPGGALPVRVAVD